MRYRLIAVITVERLIAVVADQLLTNVPLVLINIKVRHIHSVQ